MVSPVLYETVVGFVRVRFIRDRFDPRCVSVREGYYCRQCAALMRLVGYDLDDSMQSLVARPPKCTVFEAIR